MKISIALIFVLYLSSVLADKKGLKAIKKALKTFLPPFLQSTTTTTASPMMPLKCDVIWEEKVTPLCKTKHNKVCKPDWVEKCHTEFDDQCWDEPVEKCSSAKQCHTTTQNVCKTEYTVECEKPAQKWKREAGDELGADEVEQLENKAIVEDAIARTKRSIGKKKLKKVLPKVAVAALGLEDTTTATTSAGMETLCHHHPHTKCWDEPVEKCESVPVCHTEQKQRCKKVPRQVCQKVEIEKCWDEPEEVCEYMRVKVAKKHCRKPKQW